MRTSSTYWPKLTCGSLTLALHVAGPLAAQSPFVPRIAAGYSHSVSIRATGAVATHGENRSGEIGDGTTTTRISPVYLAPPAGQTWAQVAVGDLHSTALTTTGEMYSWGSNGYGQLGDGTLNDHLTPFRIAGPAGTSWAGVSAGFGHTLALAANGELYTWGDNHYGQLGIGTTAATLARQHLPTPTGQQWAQVAAGYNFSLALSTKGALYAWGNNDSGQLGEGTTTSRLMPVLVPAPAGQSWGQVAAGFWSAAALCSDGSLYTWGNNYGGQLGNGTTTGQLLPTRLAPPAGQRWLQVAVGYEHMLAICSDGALYSWGYNYEGALGDGTNTARRTPVRIAPPPGKQWAQVAAGYYHSLALDSDGQVYSSGYNYSGQLGDGTTKSTNYFLRTSVALATASPLAALQVAAFPNPFESEIRLRPGATSQFPVTLALYNLAGQCIRQTYYSQLPATEELQLTDLATLPAGFYLLQVSTAQGQQQIKLVH